MSLLANAVDAAVAENAPNSNFGLAAISGLRAAGTGQECLTYIYFGRPFPLGATILSATLRVYNTTAAAWAGTQTITLQRISATWSANRITYNNRPGVFAGTAALAKTNPVVNTEWAIDVKTLMQSVSDGGPWYGFRLSVTGTGTKYIYSAQGFALYRPRLEIHWSDAPQPPEVLRPDGNRAVSLAKPVLRFDFTDVSGNTQMAACQVQINATDVWTSPSFDSGEVATSVPELDLNTTAYGGLADAASTFWRVRVKDGVGLWSAWSVGAQFQRQTHGTLTLNNPAAPPNNFVYESTPPIDWSFTVRVQKHYQVILSSASNTSNVFWDSGKITGATTVVTVPFYALRNVDGVYNVRVRVWDTLARETTPNDFTYVEVSRDVTFSTDPTVGAVTSLVATPQSDYPWMLLTWNRTSQPDKYEITRDSKPIINDDGADFFVSGTSYQHLDRFADPRVDHTWRVYAVVNGKRDDVGPSVVSKTYAKSTILSFSDGTEPVMFLNPNTTPELTEISEVHEVLAEVPPVLITQSLRGYAGSVSGVLVDDIIARTARQQRDSLKKFREYQGTKMLLYLVDEAFEVVVFNITYKAIALPSGGVDYFASFDFFQTDF